MDNYALPKVIVVGINAWREDGSSHTLMEIFRAWNPEKLAHIYCRADLPDTKVCNLYFQISENAVLKNILKPWVPVGKRVLCTPGVNKAEIEEEHNRYAKAHNRRRLLFTFFREFVWLFGHWKSEALKIFINEFDPDLLFFPVYPSVYMGWIQRYVIRFVSKPFVCYLADDNYSYDSCSNIFSYLHRFWLRRNVKWLATHCKQMYVIVEKEKEETDNLFGTDSIILTKSIDFNEKPYKQKAINNPIKFVYTGSLIIGRDKTMALIADVINEINTAGFKVELDIYSMDKPNTEIMSRIDTGVSHFKGFLQRFEVERILSEADVVVFAEALEGKEAKKARLSFSTKITDYLSNGKCILAVGKDFIAPIDYFVRNDSAIVATNASQVKDRIKSIVENPMTIMEFSRKAYDCAIRNHEKGLINDRFISSMKNAAKG